MSENLALNLTDSARRGDQLPAVRMDDAVLSDDPVVYTAKSRGRSAFAPRR